MDDDALMLEERRIRAGAHSSSTEPDRGEFAIALMRERRRRCGFLSPEQYSAREKWTMMLARAGDPGAQMTVVTGDFSNMFNWCKDADALDRRRAFEAAKTQLLAQGYAEVYIAEYTKWTATEYYVPDLGVADHYANLWAAYQDPRVRANSEYSWIPDFLVRTESQLGPEQIAAARARGAVLYAALSKPRN